MIMHELISCPENFSARKNTKQGKCNQDTLSLHTDHCLRHRDAICHTLLAWTKGPTRQDDSFLTLVVSTCHSVNWNTNRVTIWVSLSMAHWVQLEWQIVHCKFVYLSGWSTQMKWSSQIKRVFAILKAIDFKHLLSIHIHSFNSLVILKYPLPTNLDGGFHDVTLIGFGDNTDLLWWNNVNNQFCQLTTRVSYQRGIRRPFKCTGNHTYWGLKNNWGMQSKNGLQNLWGNTVFFILC